MRAGRGDFSLHDGRGRGNDRLNNRGQNGSTGAQYFGGRPQVLAQRKKALMHLCLLADELLMNPGQLRHMLLPDIHHRIGGARGGTDGRRRCGNLDG